MSPPVSARRRLRKGSRNLRSEGGGSEEISPEFDGGEESETVEAGNLAASSAILSRRCSSAARPRPRPRPGIRSRMKAG